MDRRVKARVSRLSIFMVVLALTLVTASVIVAVHEYNSTSRPAIPTQCATLYMQFPQYFLTKTDNSFYCGANSTSDSTLEVTVEGYRFVSGDNLTQLPGGLYLMVNVTFENLGNTTLTIGPDLGFYALISNGESCTGNMIVVSAPNASFTGAHPTRILTMGNTLTVPPHMEGNVWLPFYFPLTSPLQPLSPSIVQKINTEYRMVLFLYSEGGLGVMNYNGQYHPPLNYAEFLIQPTNTTGYTNCEGYTY